MDKTFHSRIGERLACDIAVKAGDTLTDRDARIVDISRHGAQVRCDQPWDQGQTIHIELDGEYAWGTVMWAEIDRMGVRFVAPLAPASALMARMEQVRRTAALKAGGLTRMAPRVGGFGRRNIAA